MKSGPKAWALFLALAAAALPRLAAGDTPGNLTTAPPDSPNAALGAESTPAAPAPPAAAAAPPATDAATAGPAGAIPDTDLMAGPLDLTLGAEAHLSLPDGWHWVPKERLQAYFGSDGRKAGAWDLGLALSPGQPLFEFRVQFEPLGAVAEPAGPLDSAALLSKIQAAAATANLERRSQGGLDLQIPGWSEEPAYDPATKRLTWGERRVSGADERRGWHARLLGRAGVLKLDVEAPEDLMQLQTPLLQALFNALSLADGRALDDRGPADKAAAMDLPGLLLAGTLGRGSLKNEAPLEEPMSPVAVAALEAGLTLLLAWGAVAGWRGLQRRRHLRATVAAEVERLEQLEKDLGASADDVEEVHEGDDDAAAPKGDDT
ncbi:MAG TPA: DUF2167 domain-containing protein [bacterium]|nr:DUF2167 domain-containing protein [bacterium]